MKMRSSLVLCALILTACHGHKEGAEEKTDAPIKGMIEAAPLQPLVVTEPTAFDTDDPAIWVHPDDPARSLVIGTDKNQDGALYVYTLAGNIVQDKVVRGLQRPNNVDVEYGLPLAGESIDIAVTTERLRNAIRVFRLPAMTAIDGGGIQVFEGEAQRAPMGIALYKRPSDGVIFAIVGRKTGPEDGSYLWQYRLEEGPAGQVRARLVRSFGAYSGLNEIEAIAVDDRLGYVYYSDEGVGVRKYYADPALNDDRELALFAREGFTEDHEGISIYCSSDREGYILVSDQQANQFHVYAREGSQNDPHDHPLVKVVSLSTVESDGSEVSSVALGSRFPYGCFVAMSDDKTFHLYDWRTIAGDELRLAATPPSIR